VERCRAHRAGGIHVAFAVEVEDGLLAPVVPRRRPEAPGRGGPRGPGADGAGPREAAGPGDLDGAAFTVTNIGSTGVDGFTPVVAAGQCAILGLGRISERPAIRDGRLVPRKMIVLSLTFDHRVVDGAPAGRFLARVRELVERPGDWW